MHRYDICVIGAGPAGFAATVRALDLGKSVILVEKKWFGGAGVWDGALSSKTMWELSKDVRKFSLRDRGYTVSHVDVDFSAMMAAVNATLDEKQAQMAQQLLAFEREVFPGRFRLAWGTATFASEHEIAIEDAQGSTEVVYAEHIIIATGSTPRKLPHIAIDEQTIVTSDGLSAWTDFPESMVVLGAGVIGCEFATIFSNFGRTKVNIIDKAQQILPFEDEDISETVAANFEARGVTIHRGSALESMTIDNGKVKYVLSYANGLKETHVVEKALVSVGRESNLRSLKLENAGLAVNERNALVVNDTQTQQPHIYAIGDATADICLVNVGEMEGRHAVEHICGLTRQPLNYDNVSTIMFLSPEVAAVGYNEKQLRAKGISYRVAKYGYRFISRALAMRNTNGFFKLIVTDDDEMRLLGVRTIGEHASSVIQASALLMAMNKGIVELAELTHPHPSITEGIQDACRMLLGTSIMKPSVFKGELRCCRVHNGETQDLWRERQPTVCQ